MALKTTVKVGEINNLTDARFCAGMGVELLGFILKHPERKALSKEEYLSITGWLSGTQNIGEFVEASDEEILNLHKDLNFDFVQIKDYQQAKRLKMNGLNVILDIENELAPNESYDWLISSNIQNNNVLYSGDFTVEDLPKLLELKNLKGLSIRSTDEIRPGYKDMDALADILEALED
jgi:phosphoribosylanthranilate isomerase